VALFELEVARQRIAPPCGVIFCPSKRSAAAGR
jgi:hypothetical protein